MNVYDFDGTILEGDTEEYFWEYIFKSFSLKKKYKNRKKFYFALEKIVPLYNLTRAKIYSFLTKIENIDLVVNEFWDEHEKYIKEWYIKAHKEDDLVISATPRFLLIPIMERLGIKNLISTEMDKSSGKVIGGYAFGKEKVKRFLTKYPNEIVENFYSDSKKDTPMAKLAKNAYFVKGNEINKWEF